MSEREIKEKTQLIDERGALVAPGFSRHMNYVYDRNARCLPPLALKEWDFYQISDERHVLQLTIGHVSYAASVSANLFDITTGEKLTCGVMGVLPLKSIPMEENPEAPHMLRYKRKNFDMRFRVRDDMRSLSLDARDKKLGRLKINIKLENCSPDKEKLVIATPFHKSGQFYLNYKENCFFVSGTAQLGSKTVSFGENAFALLDWGRGVWPYRHEWIWGNGSTTVNGVPFGFNIGWGFGDTSAATENMFFYANKAHKLGVVSAAVIDKKNGLDVIRYTDDAGRFDFIAEPVFDNYTTTKLLFVNNSCHQVFSRWRGRAVTGDGKVIEVQNMTAFAEHAVNRW